MYFQFTSTVLIALVFHHEASPLRLDFPCLSLRLAFPKTLMISLHLVTFCLHLKAIFSKHAALALWFPSRNPSKPQTSQVF